jgi:hypothetical protein
MQATISREMVHQSRSSMSWSCGLLLVLTLTALAAAYPEPAAGAEEPQLLPAPVPEVLLNRFIRRYWSNRFLVTCSHSGASKRAEICS